MITRPPADFVQRARVWRRILDARVLLLLAVPLALLATAARSAATPASHAAPTSARSATDAIQGQVVDHGQVADEPASTAGSDDAPLPHLHLPALLSRRGFELAKPPVPTTATSPAPGASPSPTAGAQPPSTPTPSPSARPPFVPAAEFFVAPDADGSGDGSFERPWTLQQALGQPPALQPGGLVWLRGGTYTNTWKTDPSLGRISYSCGTQGRADAPIVFRNHGEERATIDGADNQVVLFVQNCRFTWFWGLEVMSSAPVRGPSRAYIYGTAPDVKFINMFLHDMADGIDLWTAATDVELYGSLIYHNGWDEPNGGHGHGIYTQNKTGVKRIQDNIFFSQYGYNVKVWSTNQFIDHYLIEGNILFNGGSLSEFASRKFNFFVVGNNPAAPARDLVVRRNYTYAGISTTTPPCNAFGQNYGVTDLILEDNYLLGQFRVGGPYLNCSIRRNHILGGTALPFITGTGFAMADYPDNTYSQDLPGTGAEVFILPNAYEAGRANIAVYNWGGADSVEIEAERLGLSAGDRYQLIHAMDPFRDIQSGTYDGAGTIAVPMTGHSFAQAIGSTKAPVSQFPHFGAFVFRRLGR